jgi:hypothetical protein
LLIERGTLTEQEAIMTSISKEAASANGETYAVVLEQGRFAFNAEHWYMRTTCRHRYGFNRNVNGERVFQGEDAEARARHAANRQWVYLHAAKAEGGSHEAGCAAVEAWDAAHPFTTAS